MMKMNIRSFFAAALLAGTLVFSACNEATEGDGDAGSDTHGTTDTTGDNNGDKDGNGY